MILSRSKVIIVIIILFIGTGATQGFVNISAKDAFISKLETIEFVKDFSEPLVLDNEDFIEIYFEETNSFITYEEAPMIPIYSKVYELPIGTKITDVIVTHSEIKTIYIKKQVKPFPPKQKIGDKKLTNESTINQEIYSSSEPYPNGWYSYFTGTGLNKKNDHVLFLSLQIHPIRYKPMENTIQYVNQIKLNIIYEESEIEKTNMDIYDLVVIAPLEFTDNLYPLITHKGDFGLKTNLVSLEDIYATYPGRDKAEKIKYFVQYAIEEWGTNYVLLVGNIKKLPIRRTYASPWEPDILSDLYYADIYDGNASFCSWDANENNLFGEVTNEGGFPPKLGNIDNVDLYADVHIGRLSCTNKSELDIVINKIIKYEKETFSQTWFKKIILVGGDTFPPRKFGLPFIFEGEITNIKVAEQLLNFTLVKLWASKRNLNAITFNRAITKGAGFVSYSGHGFEHGWGTYPPNAILNRLIFYYSFFLKGIKNDNKLPIIFFDACLTAKLDFNITDLIQYYPRFIQFLTYFTNLENNPSIFYPCFAWCFLKKDDGGAIATVGATRTAYTWVDKNGVYAGAGYLNVHFFKAYEAGATAGEMLTFAQNDYINNVGRDFFTIEEFILLGDPSVMVGGYN